MFLNTRHSIEHNGKLRSDWEIEQDHDPDFRRVVPEPGKQVDYMGNKPAYPHFLRPDVQERVWQQDVKGKYVTMEDFTKFAKTVEQSLHPRESASNIGFESMRLTPKPLSRIHESKYEEGSELEQTVIGGYGLTPREKIVELDEISKIKPVKGLPIMFTNSRLNFLTHVHSSLFKTLTSSDGSYPTVDCLDILLEDRQTWRNDPSTDLLQTVVDSTIDMQTGIVKANPFRIPVIETTMKLTDKILYMALDQLHKEFEIEWFNTMKFVTTPRFQSKYDEIRFKGDRRRRTRRHVEELVTSSSSSSKGSSHRRRSSGSGNSVLSGFFS